MKNILIIDDDKDLCFLVKKHLTESNFSCFEANTKEKAFEVLSKNSIDLVLCDLNLRKEDGRNILIAIKEETPALPVIIITGYSNVRTAVELMKLGAEDYLLKPLIPAELVFIINKRISELLEKDRAGKSVTEHTASEGWLEQTYILSPNKSFQKIIEQIDLVAPTDYSVLIYGESGSGKEAFAQEIHKRSKRNTKPFLAIDCGALSKELSGSILFGHEKGAFTGAISQKKGAFETAEGGTVFLDEIGNLPYEIQVSLLRVTQERKMHRVGGTVDIPIDIRIIVASNKNLRDAVKNKQFREDLYHRFNEFSIAVPPLRERTDDIVFYAAQFLDQSNRELNKNVKGFTEEAKHALANYHWPGNLRELKNLIKRSVLITESDTIGVDILPAEFFTNNLPARSPARPEQDPGVPLAENEYSYFINAFQQTGFNKKKTASLLKITRKTLNDKIKGFSCAGD